MKTSMQQLLLGLISALLFSGFIYFEYFDLTNKLINTLFGIGALALLLTIDKRSILVAGFFIGLLWFYWIGYSFEYQGVGYMTPVVIFAFAIIYMLFFGVLALTKKVYLRATLLFLLSFFEPFDFNWLQIELLFVESYIGVFKYQLFFVLLSLTLVHYVKEKLKYTPLVLLIFAINFNPLEQKEAPLKIKLVQTEILQENKWKKEYLAPTFQLVSTEINNAIQNNYDVVVLPESVFPLYMNHNKIVLDSLLKLSHKITIVAGSLVSEGNKHFNVTYMFENGNYETAKKVTLVPFGEYIPLPQFAREYINNTFFAGASDFTGAKEPTDFIIKGVKFRNAICYEATCQELYKGDVEYVIATSNNAWFTPSIEPTLQNLLLRYYARKNGVIIYHSANMAGTQMIR